MGHHGTPAALVVQMGTPSSPSEKSVRKYLGEFLMDPDVIDLPWILRSILVRCLILPRRPARSAAAYRAVWTAEGSPLLINSRRLVERIAEIASIPVVLGMRYGEPSIRSSLAEILRVCGGKPERLILLPLYPQYARSTTGSAVRKTRREMARMGLDSEMVTIPPVYDDPGYIGELAETTRGAAEEADHLLLSFHGLPVRHIRRTDPTKRHCLRTSDCCRIASPAHATCYRHQCLTTSRLLIEALGGKTRRNHSISFQSRLGVRKWLRPYTVDELIRLARAGIRNLAVVTPSFAADCLETLEELDMRGRETFRKAGGRGWRRVPCLNDRRGWAEFLARRIDQALTQVSRPVSTGMPDSDA